MKIKDIFKPIGKPTITYVARDNGHYEKQLKNSISSDGQVCLLTGSSKTGKTTLYKKVLEDLSLSEILIRCNDQLSVDEFWKKALEQINFEILNQISGQKSIEGNLESKIGWKWLAGLIGEVKLGVKAKATETEIREKITSNPSPEHLIPLLKNTNSFLVVEDFHYLSDNVKKSIFQLWKIFIDNEISVLVIGTTNHAVDLAFANKDLIGRIAHIELIPWNLSDLKKIVSQGFTYLGLEISSKISSKISKESVGLPIITQQTCLQIFIDQDIAYQNEIQQPFTLTDKKLNTSLRNVVTTNYSQFRDLYEILSAGIRKSRSKYNTYELLLIIFSLDPIKFYLTKIEIEERIAKIKEPDFIPPKSSLNTTLSNLKKHQDKNDIELLEWIPKQQKLFIIEPSFLFYLRWKEIRKESDLQSILDSFNQTIKSQKLFYQMLNKELKIKTEHLKFTFS